MQLGAPATPGAPPPGAAPGLPATPAGTPPGPGASPMLSPGGGAGNQAAALASLKAIVPLVHKVLLAMPVGGKEYKKVHGILGDLNDLFGGAQGAESAGLVPAAIQQAALAAKSGGMPKPPAPGLAPAPPPELPGAEAA